MTRHTPFKAAAVQASPVFLDTVATVDKACRLVREAAAGGAALVVFPEVFISAYPYWSWIANPVAASPWFQRLCESAIQVPGPEIARIAETACDCAVHVEIGCNERPAHSISTIYNTLLLIGPDGRLLGRHRKLVPTWAEKLSWAPGDGAGLRVHDTAIGPIGMLACGENTNTLARFALLAQGCHRCFSFPAIFSCLNFASAILLEVEIPFLQGNSVFTISFVIGVFSWTTFARLVRAAFLGIREMEFVAASRALGGSDARIMVRHILPNAIGPIIVEATLEFGYAIIEESGLSFLGFGIQPPTPSWGNLLSNAQEYFVKYPWLAIFPGLMIFFSIISINYIGDGLRDAFDPNKVLSKVGEV